MIHCQHTLRQLEIEEQTLLTINHNLRVAENILADTLGTSDYSKAKKSFDSLAIELVKTRKKIAQLCYDLYAKGIDVNEQIIWKE